MRVLFFGDMAGTGFGTVTQDLGRALLDRGEDVRFVSLNEIPNLPEPFASRTMSLGSVDGWIAMPRDEAEAKVMNARIEGLFGGGSWPDGWTPQAAIVLGDFAAIRRLPAIHKIPDSFPVFHYVPIEGVGLPPSWAALWQRIHPVAMSEFGADQIERLMGKRPPVVYHGVDTEAFYPVSEKRPIVLRTNELIALRSKADCRRLFGGDPDRLWLFRADRNMPRKRYASLMRSLAPLLAKYPNVDFVYHCLTEDEGGNLNDERSRYPAAIAGRMLSTGLHDTMGGADRKILNALYNASDIYVSNSAEGFGLTIAEALACGLPAVGLQYSSVPEVIGPAGYVVPVAGLIDNPYNHFWAAADEQAYTQTVEALIKSRRARRELGGKGPIHVGVNFTWAKAAQGFSTLIAERVPMEVAA